MERNKLKAIFIIVLFTVMVLSMILSIVIMLKRNHELRNEFPTGIGKAYIPYILNEHDVQLVSFTDTIILRLEKSSVLEHEYLIYVDQKICK